MYFILILLLLRYCIESNAVTTDRNSEKIRLNKDRKKSNHEEHIGYYFTKKVYAAYAKRHAIETTTEITGSHMAENKTMIAAIIANVPSLFECNLPIDRTPLRID